MGNTTQRQRCWEQYLQGKTIPEAVVETGISHQQVKYHYTSFTYTGMKEKNNREEDLLQIRMIEWELFDNIKRFHKNPNAELNNKIAQLQNTYCRVCF